MGKLEGPCRTIAMPVVVVGLIGWCGYVIGFSVTTAKKSVYINITQNSTDVGHRLDYQYTCYWFFLVTGLVTNVIIITHLHVARWFTSVVMNFLVGFYLAAGGAIVQIDGTYFFGLFSTAGTSASQYFREPEVWILVEFVGACVAVLSLILYMMIWPCISDSKECFNKAVAPSNDDGADVVFIRKGARLAFAEEQVPKGKSSSDVDLGASRTPRAASSMRQNQDTYLMDSAVFPTELTRQSTLNRSAAGRPTSPSAPPMNSGDRYTPSTLPQIADREGSMTEEAGPLNDTAKLV